MYDLILQLVLMLSLSVIVYLMAAAVPRVKGSSKEENGNGNGIQLDKMDAVLNRWKDKGLRKLKVCTMKIDNYISRQLNKDEEKL